MSSRNLFSFALALAFFNFASPLTKAAEEPSLSNLSMEVAALQTLHRFRITIEQMDAIRKLTGGSGSQLEKREKGKGSDKLRKRLLDLREALLDGDDERIVELEEKVAALLDEEENNLDDQVRITKVARQKAPDALKLLRPAQIVAFLSESANELPDPYETLVGTLDVVADLKDPEWKDLTEEIVEELKWQLGGLDPDRNRSIGEKVAGFLKKVKFLNAKDLEKQRGELEKTAKEIAGLASPTAVLNNFTEHALTELLSNPRLGAALDARTEREKEREKKEKDKEKEKEKK